MRREDFAALKPCTIEPIFNAQRFPSAKLYRVVIKKKRGNVAK